MSLSSIWKRKQQNAGTSSKPEHAHQMRSGLPTLHNAVGDHLDALGYRLHQERNAMEQRAYRHALFARSVYRATWLVRNAPLTSEEEAELIGIGSIVGVPHALLVHASHNEIIHLIDEQFKRFVDEHTSCRSGAHGLVCSCNL
jgi:hypothetical protein